MRLPRAACPHGAADLLRPRSAATGACEACGEREDLRVCQACGYVACCESHDAHDTEHFESTGHAFIRPRKGRDWLWCYLCRAYLE